MIIAPVQPSAGPMPPAGTMTSELARLGQSFQLQLARLMAGTAQAMQTTPQLPPAHAAPIQTPAFLADCYGAAAVLLPTSPSAKAKAKDKRQKKRPTEDGRDRPPFGHR